MATINTSDLTQASGVTTSTDGKYTVTGTGVFDDLMEAVNAHLDAQFNLGRLTGADYATVYLGAIQSSLQQSVQFVLGKQQADKQADQIARQTINEEQVKNAELAIKRQQIINESFANGMEVNDYIWEIEYYQADGTTTVPGTFTYVTIENLTEADVKSLMNADPHTPTWVVKDVTLNQTNNLQHKGESTSATMIAKTQEERDLLKQKRITEHAQTLTETIGSTIAVGSVMGKQAELYTQQADGFKNDAKNAFNKNIADILKMQINTAGDFNASQFVDVEHILDIFPGDPTITASTNTP